MGVVAEDFMLADGGQVYAEAYAGGLRPDTDMWLDEWSDAYMIIPKESGSAKPGPYRTANTPFARSIMRALSPASSAQRVIVKGASQLLKTQVGINFVSSGIHQTPANMLVLLPTSNIAKRVSSRIDKTIRAIPEVSEKVAEPRSRDSRNTMDTKEFDGGTLYITTAGSASNLAEIPARFVWGDEIDRWEVNVGGEGDPVTLAEARTSTFEYNKKIYFSSSPTIKGASAIQTLHDEGDQQKLFVPCPHCGHDHTLVWERMRWDADVTRAWMVCPECGGEIDEHFKPDIIGDDWRPTGPGDGGITVSFEVSALYAPLGGISWLSLVRQYIKAKAALERGDQEPMQVFYNTRLALVWDAAEETAKADALKARAEDFALRTIPAPVLVLTASVDVQPNRLEVSTVGWGEGMERWTIDFQVLWGSPAEDAVWRDLDGIINQPLLHPSGVPLPISATLIDSGGHNTQDVYNYCRLRKHRRVLAIKGASRPGRPVLAQKPGKVDINYRGKTEEKGVELWMIGTDTAKDWLASRWNLPSGPGAIHFSKDLPDEVYSQIVAERRLTRYRKGHKISEWVKDKSARNEFLDLMVYNLAAAYFLGLHRRSAADWERLRQQINPPTRDLFSAPAQTSAPNGVEAVSSESESRANDSVSDVRESSTSIGGRHQALRLRMRERRR